MKDRQPDPLFTLRQVGLSYRAKPALQGIDWRWGAGEHWAVLGANGAGKTSLASIISGEQSHFSGDLTRSERLTTGGVAYVCFERGRQLCERDQKLDCAEYESSASDTGTRVRDLLSDTAENTARWQELVDLLDLAPILDRGLRYISTGQMRKALLASALLRQPALLILDSPLDGLDADTQRKLGAALETLIERSPAVMLLCRSPAEIPAACNRILLLDRGRIRAQGPAAELRDLPASRELLEPPALTFAAPPIQAAKQAPHSAGATIALREVCVSYGELCVFRDLNWRFEAHQHSLIAGPNGCGKSTLLDMLTGDNHKAYGQDVRLFGRLRGSGESVWEIKSRFGRVDAKMQFAVPSGSSVGDVVLSGFFDSIGLRDRPTDQQRQAARQWLSALGLGGERDTEFLTLSFGLQRLVLLARAMVKNPSILLLDEATLSLDTGHRRLLLDAVDHVIDEGDCQLLFVSHTAGETPRCINQTLRFEPREDGSRVHVSDHSGTTI